jgi:hypothetical protein
LHFSNFIIHWSQMFNGIGWWTFLSCLHPYHLRKNFFFILELENAMLNSLCWPIKSAKRSSVNIGNNINNLRHISFKTMKSNTINHHELIKFSLETQMGKPTSNGAHFFHIGNLWYNPFHGFYSSSSLSQNTHWEWNSWDI